MLYNTKNGMENLRKIRAYSILAKGDTPEMIDEETFYVPSQSNIEKRYKVIHHEAWVCDCPDYKRHHVKCKHIQCVLMWIQLKKRINDNPLNLEEELIQQEIQCGKCKSFDIVKNGTRKTKEGLRQRYKCAECGHRFTWDIIKGRKASGKMIALTMDLYFKGLSLRKIADTIYQFYDIKIHHETIRRWINSSMGKINEYVDKLEPNVGDIWNVDEQKVKANGEWYYSWNVLDAKSRFLIANTLTKGRSILEAQQVFKKAKKNAHGMPLTIITDKMTSYPYVINREFDNNVIHIQAGIRDAINNNRLERFHGSWRERDKVMRGMEKNSTAKQMLNNYRTYYNFIRPHTALNGQTPAEEAGIIFGLGRNRWSGLISQSL